jgi:hypothetical protein
MTLTRPLLVNAQFLVRLQFPLAYHFTLLLRSPASRTTAFHSLMSDMAVVPILGTQFNTFAPLFIMVLAIFTLFHGYARLLNIVGLQHEDCLTGQDQRGRTPLFSLFRNDGKTEEFDLYSCSERASRTYNHRSNAYQN